MNFTCVAKWAVTCVLFTSVAWADGPGPSSPATLRGVDRTERRAGGGRLLNELQEKEEYLLERFDDLEAALGELDPALDALMEMEQLTREVVAAEKSGRDEELYKTEAGLDEEPYDLEGGVDEEPPYNEAGIDAGLDEEPNDEAGLDEALYDESGLDNDEVDQESYDEVGYGQRRSHRGKIVFSLFVDCNDKCH